MGWPKGKPRGPRKPKIALDVPREQEVIPSKVDRPLTDADNAVTIFFQDGEIVTIDAATLPRVVENGFLFMIDKNGNAHNIPIANNIKRLYWRIKSK